MGTIKNNFGSQPAITLLCIAIAILLLLAPKVSLAQSTGAILGTVKDSSGAVIPQAKVTLLNTDTNDTRTATTANDGAFRFSALGTGHYSVRVERDGFKTETETGLTLEVAQELVVNASLQVGTSTQEVTVTEQVPLVDTTNAQLGGMVNETKIAELPLNGRNYTDLTYMQPGISVNPSVNSSSQQGGLHGTGFNADGLLVRQNTYLIDGAPMVAARGIGPVSESGTSVGVAGIKEFKVVTGAFDASYGMVPGAQVIIASKGGSNQFHGEAFEYLRNSVLDATNYFDHPVAANNFQRIPAFRRNDFGADGGGPIKKDKVFFYAAYEGLRQLLGQTVVELLPGAGCHGPTGNNTGVVTSAACPQLGVGAPSVTIAPVMQGLLSLYPVPNLPGNNFTYPTGTPTQVDWGQMRVDYDISASDTMFGRYTTDKSYSLTEVLGNTSTQNVAFPQFAATEASHDQFTTLSETHIFSSALLNRLGVSYSRTFYAEDNVFPVSSYSPQGAANLTGPLFSFAAGIPTGRITFSGFPTLGINSANPQAVPVNHYVLSDDVFLTRGKHALRFGGQVYRENVGQNNLNTEGGLSFTSLPNFLQGISSTFTNEFGPNNGPPLPGRNWKWWIPQFYMQDDWRVTPTLTLNLGVRYEFAAGFHDSGGYNYALRNIATDTVLTNGSSSLAPFSKEHVEPRIGFAWDVRGDGKTSVRAGAGIYHDFALFGFLLNGLANTPPLLRTVTGTGPITLPFTFTASELATGFSAGGQAFNYLNPTVYKWNIAVERQLPLGVGLQVAYVGTKGVHQNQTVEENPISPAAIVNGRPYWNGTGTRLNTHFSSSGMLATTGESWDNALQVAVNKRVGHGFQLQASYTHSRAFDDADGIGNDCVGSPGMSEPWDFGPGALAFNRGPACTDLDHNLRVNWTYHAPNPHWDNFTAKMLQGWWFGNIWSVNTGFPFTPLLTSNRSKDGNFTSEADQASRATSADVAFCTANGGSCKYTPVAFNKKTVNKNNVVQWFNPNMFVLSPITTGPGNGVVCTAATCSAAGSAHGTLGNAGKGVLRGPGLWDVDLSLNKETPLKWLGEAGSVEFRFEAFNILNHPNFNMPNASVFTGAATDFSPYSEAPSSSAGSITSTSTTSRQLQFALKFIF